MAFDLASAKPITDGRRGFDLASARPIDQGAPPPGSKAMDWFGAAVEPNLALLSGTLAQPISGLVGLADVVGNKLGVLNVDPAQRIRETQQALTYQPQTETGKQALGAIAAPFEKLAQGAGMAGRKVLEKTGSPLAATATDTALQASPMLLGARARPSAPSTAIRHLDAMREGVKDLSALVKQGGEERLVGRGLQHAVGQEYLPKVLGKIEHAPEFVKGSKPTVAQAVAGEPGGSPLQAYSEAVAGTKGGPSAQFGERYLQQQQAREGALQDIAKPWTQESATKSRSALSGPLYEQAAKIIAPVDNELRGILSTPAMQSALKEAQVTLKNQQINVPTSKTRISVRLLDAAKKELDAQLNKMKVEGTSASDARFQSVAHAKAQLTGWLDTKVPSYGLARRAHQLGSGPVNRVAVREELLGALKNPSLQETPGAFLKATEDAGKLLKTSTGFPRHKTLGAVLKPQEAQAVENVGRDLERSISAKRPLQRTGGNTDIRANELVAHLLPNFLARPFTGTKWLADVLAARAQPKMDVLGANAMLHPGETARLLRQTYERPTDPRLVQLANRLAALQLAQGATNQGQR